MTKYERVKAWARRNEDKILIGCLGTVVIGLVIVGVKADIAYRERVTSELNGYIDQLNALNALNQVQELSV